LLYTKGGSLEERHEVTKMYVKTHGNYGPGEQRTREYDWISNPRVAGGSGQTQSHVFGYGEERLVNGAMKAVMPERESESFPKTVIVKKTVEDARAVQSDMLGTVKNLG
jgi:EF-hand domain-containing family member B